MQRASRIVLGISLLFLMAVLGLAAVALVRGHSDAMQRAESTATVAADAVAAHVRWLLEASSQTLRRVEEVTQRSADPDTGVLMTGDLERMAEDLPHEVDLALYDAEGELIFPGSSENGFPQRLDMDLFEDSLDGGLGLSRFVADIAGNGGFVVASPVQLDSLTSGMAVVLVSGELSSEFWRRLALGPDSAISIAVPERLKICSFFSVTGNGIGCAAKDCAIRSDHAHAERETQAPDQRLKCLMDVGLVSRHDIDIVQKMLRLDQKTLLALEDPERIFAQEFGIALRAREGTLTFNVPANQAPRQHYESRKEETSKLQPPQIRPQEIVAFSLGRLKVCSVSTLTCCLAHAAGPSTLPAARRWRFRSTVQTA